MPLPTFIIGGERRGGTTSLYYALRQHPDIYLYSQSELNYFIEEEVNGRQWRHEPVNPHHWETTHSIDNYAALFSNSLQTRAIGHKGADLLFWHPAHARIARYVPNARFIFTLRHPVDRAWSHYWIERSKGRETQNFEKALSLEDKRAGKSDWARFHLSYRARGFYDISLKRFFKTFPRERVLIVTLEETISQPRKILQQVYRFLAVDPELGLDVAGTHKHKKENWASERRPWAQLAGIRQLVSVYESATEKFARFLTRSKESRRLMRSKLQRPVRESMRKLEMPRDCRLKLDAVYAAHIVALEELLGRSFEEWRR